MSAREEWEIYNRAEFRTGTYYTLNVVGRRDTRVTVKARALPGEPYVCITCKSNDCQHVAFVRANDTRDSNEEAA